VSGLVPDLKGEMLEQEEAAEAEVVEALVANEKGDGPIILVAGVAVHVVPGPPDLTVRRHDRKLEADVVGTTAEYFEVVNTAVSQGRLLTPIDSEKTSNVCVIGAKVRRELFTYEDPIGQQPGGGPRRVREHAREPRSEKEARGGHDDGEQEVPRALAPQHGEEAGARLEAHREDEQHEAERLDVW